MDATIIYIIIGVAALLLGILLGKLIFAKNTQGKIEAAEIQSQKLLSEAQLKADAYKKEREFEAKEKFIQLKSDHDREIQSRSSKINEAENRIKQKEQSLHSKEGNLEKQIKDNDHLKETLNQQIEAVNIKRAELEKHQEEHIRRLEKVSGLSADEAKVQLIEGLKQEANSQALTINKK